MLVSDVCYFGVFSDMCVQDESTMSDASLLCLHNSLPKTRIIETL